MIKRKLEKIVPTSSKQHKYLSLEKNIKALNSQQLGLFVNSIPSLDKNSSITYLVFTPVDIDGKPVDLANTVSLELPCPPYCGKGGNGSIQVITVD